VQWRGDAVQADPQQPGRRSGSPSSPARLSGAGVLRLGFDGLFSAKKMKHNTVN
jgi:hypothetical protein